MYWFVQKPFRKLYARLYLYIPLAACRKINIHRKPEKAKEYLEIVVIGFNNDEILSMQIAYIKRYCKDQFHLTIADNSSEKPKAENIKRICFENNVGYIKLPLQPLFKSSGSHGLALNWVFKNFILKRRPKYFGFLDHDVFPIKDVKLKSVLDKQPFYGLKHYAVHSGNRCIWDQNTPEFWYLWAGFCFYNTAYISSKRTDFMPVIIRSMYFDTGGNNFQSLYSKSKQESIYFPKWEMIKMRSGGLQQSDYIDFIDEKWVHTYNGSYWYKVDRKEDIIKVVLRSFEEKGYYLQSKI